MTGKRIYPDLKNGEHFPLLNDGEYRKCDGYFFAQAPNGGGLANLRAHQVTEHEDGSITVSPSILIKDGTGKEWHGFLEHGIWRTC